jgi:hypothetical protein
MFNHKIMATEPEDVSDKFARLALEQSQFVTSWLGSHKEQTKRIDIDNKFTAFLCVFSHTKSYSFDHLVINLESIIDPEDVLRVIGVAFINDLLTCTDGIISLV